MEIKAFNKGLKVISSCKTTSHIMGAYNYVHNYRNLFGKKKLWKELYNFCGRKRNMLTLGNDYE